MKTAAISVKECLLETAEIAGYVIVVPVLAVLGMALLALSWLFLMAHRGLAFLSLLVEECAQRFL